MDNVHFTSKDLPGKTQKTVVEILQMSEFFRTTAFIICTTGCDYLNIFSVFLYITGWLGHGVCAVLQQRLRNLDDLCPRRNSCGVATALHGFCVQSSLLFEGSRG